MGWRWWKDSYKILSGLHIEESYRFNIHPSIGNREENAIDNGKHGPGVLVTVKLGTNAKFQCRCALIQRGSAAPSGW
jgi:hypothetical protein